MVFGTDIFFTKNFSTTALQFSVSREDKNGQGVQAFFSEWKGANIGTHVTIEELAQKIKGNRYSPRLLKMKLTNAKVHITIPSIHLQRNRQSTFLEHCCKIVLMIRVHKSPSTRRWCTVRDKG